MGFIHSSHQFSSERNVISYTFTMHGTSKPIGEAKSLLTDVKPYIYQFMPEMAFRAIGSTGYRRRDDVAMTLLYDFDIESGVR